MLITLHVCHPIANGLLNIRSTIYHKRTIIRDGLLNIKIIYTIYYFLSISRIPGIVESMGGKESHNKLNESATLSTSSYVMVSS